MKTAELTGVQLDCWVARAEGHAVQEVRPGEWKEQWPAGHWHYIRHPSTTWSDGGPIIDREKMRVRFDQALGAWVAAIGSGNDKVAWTGPTALVAAMRAKVASKFGDEVPDA